MNKIIIIGRLPKAPEVTYTSNGKAKCSLNLAVDRKFKDRDGNKITDWFRVDLWDKQAEIAGQYLDKGSQVCIEGAMQRDEYTDKNGVKQTKWYVQCHALEFVGPGKSQQDGGFKQKKAAAFNDFDEPSERTLDEELERNQPYGF